MTDDLPPCPPHRWEGEDTATGARVCVLCARTEPEVVRAELLADLARRAPEEIREAAENYAVAWHQVIMVDCDHPDEAHLRKVAHENIDRLLALHQAAVEQAEAEGRKEAFAMIESELDTARWAQVKPDGTSSITPEHDTFAAGYQFAIAVVRALAGESGVRNEPG